MDILNVTGEPLNDTSIEEYQFHTYQPYIPGKLNYNDEIRIPIQDLDAHTLPSNSYLEIRGKFLTETGIVPTKLKLINNGISFLFREIRYELNGVVIDSVRDVGLVSTIKNYLSYNQNESVLFANAGWFPQGEIKLVDAKGNFNVCIPLKLLSGFFEDFFSVILNMKQELVLLRSSDDIDAVTFDNDSEKPKIELTQIFWRVPHIKPSIKQELRLNKIIQSNRELPIKFRSWQLIEYPTLSKTSRHTWAVKTSTKIETPRHIIIGFQQNARGKITSDMSQFKHINLSNIKVFLNSERYPYNDLHLDFTNNNFAILYEMFGTFQTIYYNRFNSQPVVTPQEFKNKAPLVHIDCSRQKEVIQTGSVVLRIEFETDTPVPDNVSAYCLILHEKEFSYNPLTKIVKQY